MAGIVPHLSTLVKQMFGLPNTPAAAPPAAPARRRRISRARNLACDSVDIGNPYLICWPRQRASGALNPAPWRFINLRWRTAMASGRTVSASFLTSLDGGAIALCESISQSIREVIPDKQDRRDFQEQYGKISKTRDSGAGRGGGKLQRDAICTRGRQGKAPFSNRNLRWHPLLVAESKPNFAKEIEEIEIEGTDLTQTLNFVVKDDKGKSVKFPSDKAHKMIGKFVALPKHWIPHIEMLRHWSDTLWNQNSCVIAAQESCNWWDSVETYAVLGIATAAELYGADLGTLWEKVTETLRNQAVDEGVSLPSEAFPDDKNNILQCPLCLRKPSEGLNDFRASGPSETWQPGWRTSKQQEGDDASIQIMHVNPLVESEIRHKADNVRYGHRWCNVSMSDHSLDETLDFMEFVVRAHNRGE